MPRGDTEPPSPPRIAGRAVIEGDSPMHATRLRSLPGGDTELEDIELPGQEIDSVRWLSEPIAVTALRARAIDRLTEQPMHPAPRRQMAVILRGTLEVETRSGLTRRFGPGDLVFLEDTEGSGHITRVVDAPAALLEIQLASEVR